MKISGHIPQVSQLLGKQKQMPGQSVTSVTQTAATDKVEISSQAGKVRDLVAKTINLPEEGGSRVEALRGQIAGGEYKMDSEELAEKMLSALL